MPRFHKNLTNKGYDLSTITGHKDFFSSNVKQKNMGKHLPKKYTLETD